MKLPKTHIFCLLLITLLLTSFTMTGCGIIRFGHKISDNDIVQAAMDNDIIDVDLKRVAKVRVWASALPTKDFEYIYINADKYEEYRPYWDKKLWDTWKDSVINEDGSTTICKVKNDGDPVFTYIEIRRLKKEFLKKQYYSVSISKHVHYYRYLNVSRGESLENAITSDCVKLTEETVSYRVHKEKGKLVFEKE